jgi:hypothetical protein
MADLKAFETALMKQLNEGQVDKVFLKKVSATIVGLKKQGLVIDQVYVKGQPRPERVIINGIVDPDFWVKFRDLGFNFRKFEVFPYGIINPEGFRFQGTIGM